jgi:hypothetical protein
MTASHPARPDCNKKAVVAWAPRLLKVFFGLGLLTFKSRGALPARKVKIKAKIIVPEPPALHLLHFLDQIILKYSNLCVNKKSFAI